MGFKLKSIDRVLRKVSDAPFILYGGKKFRHKVGLTGKRIKSTVLGLFPGGSNSARSYSSSVYGPTGSIVGRF